MGLLHDRGDQAPKRRFQMRERMLSIGDDYWIEDESGERAYLVDGKAMRLRETWVLKDRDGKDVAEIKERKLSVRDKMHIDLEGREATVTKRVIGLRDHFKVEVDGGADLKVHGNIVDHEYEIDRGGDKVAEISKKWFRLRDTYGVEIAPGEDPVLILAVTVAVDGMTHDLT
ncbi:MAG TPA: LURP-one-related family protein [Acidimicrobiales bacterium]|nr:LURP-one-related family protein [Acidimicrobiales bacterium]